MRRLLLALLPLLLVCGLLEVVLRSTHLFNARLSWAEPDREIGWRFTPGREYWFFLENDHPITGRINAAGWRDRERSVTKAPRTFRIAVLGDSFVEAFQVELDSTFLSIAERRLNESAPGGCEVMNFGRSGMSQAEELIILERDVLRWHPDAVLLVFTPGNDIVDISPATAPDLGRPFFRSVSGDSLALDVSFAERREFKMREIINPFKQRSALISLAIERYNALRLARAGNRTGAAPLSSGLTREHRMCTAHPDSTYVGNYELCKLLIARMARICKSQGIQFLVASVPVAHEAPVIEMLQASDPTFAPDFFDRDLGALGEAEGFWVVPVANAFSARARAMTGRLNWAHWSYAGHRVVADLVTPVLQAASGANSSD